MPRKAEVPQTGMSSTQWHRAWLNSCLVDMTPGEDESASHVRCLWFFCFSCGPWGRKARRDCADVPGLTDVTLAAETVGSLDGLCAPSKPRSLHSPSLRKYSFVKASQELCCFGMC